MNRKYMCGPIEFADNTRQFHQYGYNPYDSHSGVEWYAVATTLGLPL